MLPRITRSKTTPSPKKTHTFRAGSYVWAKMDGKYWAAVVVSHTDVGFTSSPKGKSWIFWFGDYRVSEVRHSLMQDFCEHYKTNFTRSRRKFMPKDWVGGVFEAIREIGLPETKTLSRKELVLWAKTNLSDAYLKKYAITDFVKGKLDAIRKLNAKSPSDVVKESASYNIRQTIEDYKDGKVSTLTFCLGCYDEKISVEHPIFLGYFCVDCKERFKENFYKTSKNAKKAFCVICGFGGDIIMCRDDECKFVYCIQCIQDLASKDAYEALRDRKIWFCFICHENKKYKGVLSVKYNWKDNIETLFSNEKKTLWPAVDNYKKGTSSLSINSNITLILAEMAKLKNEMGILYTAHMGDSCIKITEDNYPEIMNLFTSNKQLTEQAYQKMTPVNLLVCGRSDITRNGLKYPTKILYEFHRVLKSLQAYNTSLFWLFEWDSDISLQEQVTVTRLLQCDPIVIENSGNKNKQVVWSNVPYDITDIEFFQKNILFTDPYCYQQ